jgi:hypothetical protein
MIFEFIASIAAISGLFLTAYQIYAARKQIQTSFEDDLAKEYRELASQIPTKTFFGEPFTEDEFKESIDEMYRYFDLCNHQAFLFNTKRVSDKTWKFWKDGIDSNLKRPAFKQAWAEIAARSGNDFSELRQIFPPGKYPTNTSTAREQGLD